MTKVSVFGYVIYSSADTRLQLKKKIRTTLPSKLTSPMMALDRWNLACLVCGDDGEHSGIDFVSVSNILATLAALFLKQSYMAKFR